MRSLPRPSRTEARLICAFVVLTVLVCTGLFAAAVLVPAPPAVLPLVAAVCIAGPMVAAWELRGARGALPRADEDGAEPPPLDSRAVAALRQHLEQLPETNHPLGF